jgi:hypothetical protein
MKLKFTKELPTKPGFYWWTNFSEHTPCVLEVKKNHLTGRLYANNGEYTFPIPTKEEQFQLPLQQEINEDDIRERDGTDVYTYDDELWCYIPNPWLPNETKQIKPDSY